MVTDQEEAIALSSRVTFDGVSVGRRRNMQANRSKDTKPEMTVRRLLHSMGYRFRLHAKNLPGRPDVVFTARRKVVDVRGCFWHCHGCHPLGQVPKSRIDYWGPKLASTKQRDAANEQSLRQLGWEVLVIWECELRANPDRIRRELTRFAGPPKFADQSG